MEATGGEWSAEELSFKLFPPYHFPNQSTTTRPKCLFPSLLYHIGPECAFLFLLLKDNCFRVTVFIGEMAFAQTFSTLHFQSRSCTWLLSEINLAIKGCQVGGWEARTSKKKFSEVAGPPQSSLAVCPLNCRNKGVCMVAMISWDSEIVHSMKNCFLFF